MGFLWVSRPAWARWAKPTREQNCRRANIFNSFPNQSQAEPEPQVRKQNDYDVAFIFFELSVVFCSVSFIFFGCVDVFLINALEFKSSKN